MAKVYATESAELKPTKLTPSMHVSIGRLIRAFAEIEDAVNIHICKLSSVKEAAAVIFLGRVGIATKIQMAFAMSKLHSSAHVDVVNALFLDEPFNEAKTCRNAVAHGFLLGAWGKPKKYAFLTSHQLAPSDFNMRREVVSYVPSDLKEYADFAEGRSIAISKVLQLDSWRRERFKKSLLPHRKGLKKQSVRGASLAAR